LLRISNFHRICCQRSVISDYTLPASNMLCHPCPYTATMPKVQQRLKCFPRTFEGCKTIFAASEARTNWSFASGLLLGVLHRFLLFSLLLLELCILLLSTQHVYFLYSSVIHSNFHYSLTYKYLITYQLQWQCNATHHFKLVCVSLHSL